MLKKASTSVAAGIIASLGEAPPVIARTVVAILFLYYLTDVAGMAPLAAGILIMVGRIWEAALEALLTRLHGAGVTPGWWRGFRAAGVALFAGISFGILWYPCMASGRSAASVVTGMFLFALYILGLSMFSVPYKLYMKRRAQPDSTRSFVEASRFGVVFFCGLAASVLPLLYIHDFADVSAGFVRVAAVISIIITAAMLCFFIGTCAYKGSLAAVDATPLRDVRHCAGCRRVMIAVMLLFALCYAAIHMLEGFVIFYMKYWIGSAAHAPYLFIAVVLSSLFTAPLWVLSMGRFGVRKSLGAALVAWAASQALWLLPGPGSGAHIIAAIGVAVGIGYGGIHIVPGRIVASVRESLIRENAAPPLDPDVFSGIGSKLGAAFAPPVIGAVLQASGYAANAAQQGVALRVIPLLMCAGPLVFILAALLFFTVYMHIKTTNIY